jgi:hypothetical protein
MQTFMKTNTSKKDVISLDIEYNPATETFLEIGAAWIEAGSDHAGHGKIQSRSWRDVTTAKRELVAIATGRIPLGHNLGEHDLPLLKRHGFALDDADGYLDTLHAELLLHPNRSSYALRCDHTAASDALRALELYKNQQARSSGQADDHSGDRFFETPRRPDISRWLQNEINRANGSMMRLLIIGPDRYEASCSGGTAYRQQATHGSSSPRKPRR